MLAKMEVVDDNQAHVRDQVEQFNHQMEQLVNELEAKTKSEEDMAEKLAVKTNDYSRLSDAFYRLKKEKDETDTERQEYTSQLEAKIKQQSKDLEAS